MKPRAIALAAAILCAAVSVAAPAAAAHRSLARCSTRGLSARAAAGGRNARVRIVRLSASGMSCAKASRVARAVVREAAAGKSISFSGASGFSMFSETACGGCAPVTRIALRYPHAELSISLAGGSAARRATRPQPFPLPALPAPAVPGPGGPPATV